MTDLTLIPATNAPIPAEPFIGKHLIDGAWVESADGAWFERHSPAHGDLISRSAQGGVAETEAAIAAARRAFDAGDWAFSSGADRAKILLRVADLIDEKRDQIALIETLESGKPISQAKAEIDGAADLWRYAAALARTMHGDSHNSLGPDMLGLVLKEPIGVVSLITPWNFPFLIISQKLPFALAAGCTAVVKPSEMTPSTTVILGGLLQEAGLPAGVVNIVLGYGDPVGALMSTHADVDMVSFTGSTGVGKRISAAASETLKKVSLELGGKNPQVIFPDADLDAAADAITFGIYFNAGECCNSGSRIIVHEDIAEALTEKVVALSRRVPFGDPLDPKTQVGAIISPEHQAKIDGYVKQAVAAGATLALGGAALDLEGMDGQFYGPTVVTGVTPEMPIASEEVFGPVLSVLTFRDMEGAISLANSASYGLSAGVWSRDVHTCLAFSRRVQAGTVWTNTWMDGFAELPFGGVKQSGQGRELGRYGLEEFLEVKTVQMRIGDTRAPWVA
ncbi:aldehyde dehydrogenase family protein [Roseobacter sp. HKCCD9010]|uniref:aldehyde dehydrogenase family protein n=1 Tax=unclassified Roseobacter TaxID=196798 RepID=UPI0014926A5F|nr:MULTISPECIES: aldehyde dehydrogenase family protein [unclassified Roseobacter]MBF9049711.1 aldehyde dehydrogenase family protein [Rhodobacterales bacterium HKCCD4356]NNV11711.1 aldehyde dehydrogenase family protein [Roseobacter sp. HKCCD7357]NNV15895.1 aldehyde dehydrogenase family protein [Roseobacter sp. HKCCD8768]NNV25355.1 aldehyde dehydrogenase family protein [Roseobacter sp. HKCCD8192]NNV29612.1 aldehyde dehydrogenase family protein [Roseobacter sp. HKCCD9061]